MISQNTISKVFDLELHQVISKYVELKQSGANYKGFSPFVDEKTPSFMVSPAKSLFKCFSSGTGGNSGVSFVMKKLNLDYPDAIKEIAGQFNIPVELDNSEDTKKYAILKAEQNELFEANAVAMEYFFAHSEELDRKKLRVAEAERETFSIGFAPDTAKGLCQFAKAKGISERILKDAGLINKGKSVYDVFRNRVIFPIYNHRKQIIGFGGRCILSASEMKKKEVPKYINTKDTKAFNKSKSLFGIQLAIDELRKTKKANIVEGYYDVTALHSENILNTVAPCGTSFTEDQALLLKKYCDSIRLIMDGDKAGVSAAKKAIPMLVELGFTIEICVLPEKEDPDSLVKNGVDGEDFIQYLENITEDALLWLIKSTYKVYGDTLIGKNKAQKETEALLSLIPDARLRNQYVKAISADYKISKTEVEKNIKLEIEARRPDNEDDDKSNLKLPPGANKEDFEDHGFVEVCEKKNNNTGYHFPIKSSGKIFFEQKSNFIVRPLFHVQSKNDNKRLIEITNHKKTALIDVFSKAFIGMTQFQEAVIDEGNFLFMGSKGEFQRIVKKIMEQFITCEQIGFLGWQKEGFYAFADGIAETSFKKIDNNGIIKFGEKNYFLPAFSDAYRNLRKEDDVYSNDRFFTYRRSPIKFRDWAEQFVKVHEENGRIAVCFFITILFRDFIYQIHSVFPHLFGVGGVGTGKSYCARSINSIFFGGQPGFNLTSGTNPGFFRKIERVTNAVAWFDEYNNEIDQARFQGLKAAFDGLGHEKAAMTHDSRSKSTDINSACFITGQYFPTRDDNSLFTRSIVLSFNRKAENLTTKEIEEGTKLKKWEQEGLSSLIVDVIKYRGDIEENFEEISFLITEDMKDCLEGHEYSGRIMQNFVLILTPVKILGEKLNLPFSFDTVFKQAVHMILDQSDQVHDSDALGTFWKMLEFLLEDHQIEHNKDFKIEKLDSVNIRQPREKDKAITFKTPTRCLFIRFAKIQPLYMKEHRTQFGENGVAETSLKNYMKNHKAFIGLCPGTVFERGKSSAYVFDYDQLDVRLQGWANDKEKGDMFVETGEKSEEKQPAF